MAKRHGKLAMVLLMLTLLTAGAAAAQDEAAAAPGEVGVDLAFGRDVDRATRSLIDAGTEFGADAGKVYCLSHVVGMAAPDTITHAWYYEGKTMAHVKLAVGSADWRTWSSKNFLPAWTGQWEVKVLDESGKVLASGGFSINQE